MLDTPQGKISAWWPGSNRTKAPWRPDGRELSWLAGSSPWLELASREEHRTNDRFSNCYVSASRRLSPGREEIYANGNGVQKDWSSVSLADCYLISIAISKSSCAALAS